MVWKLRQFFLRDHRSWLVVSVTRLTTLFISEGNAVSKIGQPDLLWTCTGRLRRWKLISSQHTQSWKSAVNVKFTFPSLLFRASVIYVLAPRTLVGCRKVMVTWFSSVKSLCPFELWQVIYLRFSCRNICSPFFQPGDAPVWTVLDSSVALAHSTRFTLLTTYQACW